MVVAEPCLHLLKFLALSLFKTGAQGARKLGRMSLVPILAVPPTNILILGQQVLTEQKGLN